MSYQSDQQSSPSAEPCLGRVSSALPPSIHLPPSRALCLLLLLLFLPSPLTAVEFPLRWRWSNPGPHGNNVVDMAFSSALNLAVQVAEKGQVYTSDDLQLWIPRESQTTESLRAVTFFKNRIVITGQNGTVLYADSVNEFKGGTLLDGPTDDWLEAVAASPSLLVAVGDNAAIYTSSNGKDWKRQSSPVVDWLRGVAYGNNQFVAVGELGRILTSSNGTNWNRLTTGILDHLNRVYFSKDTFTVLGETGLVLKSTTGSEWTPVITGATNDLHHGSANSSAQIVVGDNEVRLYDGSAWSNQLARSASPPDWTYYCNVAQENYFLIAGQTGMMAEGFKTNGSPYLWRQFSASPRHWLFDMFYASNIFVTVGDNAAVMSSANAIDWTLELVPEAVTNTTFLGVGGTTNLLLAVGDSGGTILSPNTLTNISVTNIIGTNIIITNQTVSTLGVEWFALPSRPTTEDLQGVTFFQGLYILTGGNGTILTSPNGTNWTRRTTSVSSFLSGAAASDQIAVVTGDDGRILTSADGINWTLRTSGTPKWLYRVRYVGGKFIALGETGTLLVSDNGISWSPRNTQSPHWLNDITLIDDAFFVVGNQGTVLTSTNTTQWTSRGTITKKSLFGVATDSAQLVTSGYEGIILRSPVIPDLTPVTFLAFSRFPSRDHVYINNLYLFAGVPDQRFSLDYRADFGTNSWVTGPTLEFLQSSGTFFYLEQIALTNAPSLEFYRGTLVP